MNIKNINDIFSGFYEMGEAVKYKLDNVYLTGLVDTPVTYESGKYLVSSTGGVEWRDLDLGSNNFTGLGDTPVSYESGKYLVSSTGGVEWRDLDLGSNNFTGLGDTPVSYESGKYLVSNTGGVEWRDVSTSFTGLSDTPAAYASGKYLVSNTGGVEWGDISASLTGLLDTPPDYASGLFLRSTKSGSVWSDLSEFRLGQSVDLSTYCSTFHIQSNTTSNNAPIEDFSINEHPIVSNVIHSAFETKYGSSSFSFDNSRILINGNSSDFYFIHDNSVPNYTIQSWVHLTDTKLNPIISTAGEDSDKGFRLFVDESNKVNFNLIGDNQSYLSLTSNETLNSNEWYHIAIEKVNDQFNLFITGNLDSTQSATSYPVGDSTFSVNIGAGHFGTVANSSNSVHKIIYYKGYMQDLRIDKSQLTSEVLPPEGLLTTTCNVPQNSTLNFSELTDTPIQYGNTAGYFVRVNENQNGLEFADISLNTSANVEYQNLTLNQEVNSSNVHIVDFSTNSLTNGKVYRLSTNIYFQTNNISDSAKVVFYNGNNQIFSMVHQGGSVTKSTSLLFNASSPNLTASGFNFSNDIKLPINIEPSFIQIEEQPNFSVSVGDVANPVDSSNPVVGDYILSVDEMQMFINSNTTTDDFVLLSDDSAGINSIANINNIEINIEITNTGEFDDLTNTF